MAMRVAASRQMYVRGLYRQPFLENPVLFEVRRKTVLTELHWVSNSRMRLLVLSATRELLFPRVPLKSRNDLRKTDGVYRNLDIVGFARTNRV